MVREVLTAALAVSLLAADGGPPRSSAPLTIPPPRPPSRIAVNSWSKSVYEKPILGGYQVILVPWDKADVIDAIIYPRVIKKRLVYTWTIFVGGDVRESAFTDSREGAEAAVGQYVEPLIAERNTKYSREPKK